MRSLLRGCLALTLTLGLVACSDSGDDDVAEETTTTTTSTSTTIPPLAPEEIDTDASPYCATWAELRGVQPPAYSGNAEGDAVLRREHYAQLLPIAERLVEQAEPEIRSAAELALAQVREVAETGAVAPFTTEEAAERQQELAAYARDHCGKD